MVKLLNNDILFYYFMFIVFFSLFIALHYTFNMKKYFLKLKDKIIETTEQIKKYFKPKRDIEQELIDLTTNEEIKENNESELFSQKEDIKDKLSNIKDKNVEVNNNIEGDEKN